jgi:hypothetical protein
MTMSKILRHLTVTGILSIVLICGCQKEAQTTKQAAKPAAAKSILPKKGEYKIALNPAPGQEAKYKITTEASKSIVWEGPVPKKDAFEPSSNNDKVEMVITEQVQNVNPDGKIVAKVTIDSLKYVSVSKNSTTIDFDSSRKADADNSLNKMIGKGYTIEVKPDNSTSVTDLNDLRALFSSQSANDMAARNILFNDVVIDRQAMLQLPAEGNDTLKPSGTWTRNKTFSFGLMGIKSYEKIYKLKEVKEAAGEKIAVIDMNAIPSSEVESKFRNQQAGANFPKMFDTNETYTGKGEIDLSKGLIDKYSETLNATWIAALPPGPGDTVDSNEPVVLKMTAVRSYNLEMIK